MRARRHTKAAAHKLVEKLRSYANAMGPQATSEQLFVDVTYQALPSSWFAWNHSGFARSHQGTPTFVDFNHDGVLDYFYHNHYQGEPSTDWDMGLSSPSCDFSGQLPFYESVGAKALLFSEPEGSKWKKP